MAREAKLVIVRGGSRADHQMGDIRRDEDDYFIINSGETGESGQVLGHWLEGFGFMNVQVAVADTRKLTHDEADRIHMVPMQIGSTTLPGIVINPSEVDDEWEPKIPKGITAH